MELHNEAIGARQGEAKFYLPEEQRLHVWGSTRPRRSSHSVKETTVSMKTLEDVGAQIGAGNSRNVAMWIDVEGAALEVINSGLPFLENRVCVVFVEIYDTN